MNTYVQTFMSNARESFSWSVAEDIDGKPVERTKEAHPYSYDVFITYRRKKGSHKGAVAVYSDRLWQWDNKKFDRSMKDAGLRGQIYYDASEEQVEDFLRRYYDDQGLLLEAIGEGCNFGIGYPYWVFWFTPSKKEKSEK